MPIDFVRAVLESYSRTRGAWTSSEVSAIQGVSMQFNKRDHLTKPRAK